MTPAEILEKMQGVRILVVGDQIKDLYYFGRVERICPEAPVPVFILERSETRDGGAANVFRQLQALGCAPGSAISRVYSHKTRYMVGQHMLLRVDNDRNCVPTDDDIENAEAYVTEGEFQAVVLSDYAKGWLSFEMCRAVIGAAWQRHVPVIVDPKGPDWQKFSGCDLICPSTSDVFSEKDLITSVARAVLLKRGAQGMLLADSTSLHEIPTTARRVYDVTGAGDCIVAVVAAAVAVGASFLEAAQIAALAAGFVVGEVGTTVCPRKKLKELIDAIPNA